MCITRRFVVAPLAAIAALASSSLSAQSVQYRAPSGVEYRSMADTGAIARASRALAEAPADVERIIALGTAQAGARQMREAIATFTRGIERHPDAAILYRWRGHRYLSVREFAKARRDLEHALTLDSALYGALYHLGIIHFIDGDFTGAADLFRRAQPHAPDAGELAGSTDWLWMSLARARRRAEAQAMLDRHPDSLRTAPDYAYTKRLRMYRGEVTPEALITPADTADVQVATLSFGLGNWYLVHGDSAKARSYFQRAVASAGWPGFGFICSEAELRRMK